MTKASTCVTQSSAMATAMRNPEYSTPNKEVLALPAPNTVKQRQARELFWKAISQPQGVHVRF